MKVYYFIGISLLFFIAYFSWDQTRTTEPSAGDEQVGQRSGGRIARQIQSDPTPPIVVRTSENDNTPITIEDVNKWLLDLETIKYGEEYKALLSRVADFYGKHDPETGKEWLLTMDNSPVNLVAFSVFGSAYAAEFGLVSLEFFDKVSHPAFAEAYLNSTTSRLSLENPSETLTFVSARFKTIGNPKYTIRSITNIAALNGVEETLQLIRDHEASNRYVEPMVVGVAFRIMSEEKWGASMSNFLGGIRRIEREEVSVKTVESIVNATGTSGFDELVNVISSLPKSKARDHGSSLFAKRVATKEPRSAVYWVNQIENPEVQVQTALTVLQSVERFDPTLRKELIKELRLQPGAAQRLNSHFIEK